MRINLNTLKEKLPTVPMDKLQAGEVSRPEYLPSIGVFRAIEAAHEADNSKDVDWSSFTLAEAEEALSHAMGYEAYEYIDEVDEDERPFINRGNAVHQYLHSCNIIGQLKRTAPEKQVSEVQFF